MLLRTGVSQEVDLDMTITPLGAVSRVENALSNFEGERAGYRGSLCDAERRLASYRSRVGDLFAFSAELKMKREQLADVEKSLASASEGSAEGQALAA